MAEAAARLVGTAESGEPQAECGRPRSRSGSPSRSRWPMEIETRGFQMPINLSQIIVWPAIHHAHVQEEGPFQLKYSSPPTVTRVTVASVGDRRGPLSGPYVGERLLPAHARAGPASAAAPSRERGSGLTKVLTANIAAGWARVFGSFWTPLMPLQGRSLHRESTAL
jgi:hypothetical protein